MTPLSMVYLVFQGLFFGNNLVNIMIGIKLPLAPVSILNVSLVFKPWDMEQLESCLSELALLLQL